LRSWTAAGLIAAAVAAPTAQATRPDDRAGTRGPGVVAAATLSPTLRPDDRAGVRGAGPSGVIAVQTVSAGFHWGDAAIGGAFGLGLALLATGAAFVSLRRRSSPRPA
jgi:hypothetical protein